MRKFNLGKDMNQCQLHVLEVETLGSSLGSVPDELEAELCHLKFISYSPHPRR